MKKIKIFKTKSEFESFVNSVDVEILQIDIKAVEVSYYFQDGFAAVVFYKENNDNNNDDNHVNRPITKEQAIKILQDAYDRGIDPDGDVEIFGSLKLAITTMQAYPDAPDQGPV